MMLVLDYHRREADKPHCTANNRDPERCYACAREREEHSGYATEIEALIAHLDSTTRELFDALSSVIGERSGDITRDRKIEWVRINNLRISAGLPAISKDEAESWPGEFESSEVA